MLFPLSFSLHGGAEFSIVKNLKGLVGRFKIFRVQETLLNQGCFHPGQGLFEGGIEAYRQGYPLAGWNPIPFLVSWHMHPNINEAMTFILGQRKEYRFPGIFGNLTYDFRHHFPLGGCLPLLSAA
jgi:hypothetical protein